MPPAVGPDGVQQRRVKALLQPFGDDKVVVVKGIAAAHQRIAVAGARQRCNRRHVAPVISKVKPGQRRAILKGAPPEFLPGRGDVQIVHRRPAQQFLPLRANLPE